MARKFFCEKCKKSVPATASSCPHCGTIFSSVKCPECGFTGSAGFFREGCPSCGFLGETSKPAAGSAKKTDSAPAFLSTTLFRLILGLSVIVLGVLILLISYIVKQ